MLVGLTGRVGAGKDTVADRLELLFDGTFERRSFAGPLKQSFCNLFGITLEQLEHWKRSSNTFLTQWGEISPGKDTQGWTMRELLQRYGTEAHRDVFGTDFWLDQTLPFDRAHKYNGGLIVITDCRFPNEAERVKNCGGVVFEVVGPDGVMLSSAEHASDRALPMELLDGFVMNKVRGDDYRTLDAVLRSMLAPSLALKEVKSC